ncbi:MAG: NAD(P)-dependent glycerol-3-phosphate dehydrogenase [Deltaproteobacteria bacterium]|nr:NAD(P)-dependent glycerol-3-phosphate dehydrogenase [Deltaproteobacteria bacterium]
MVTRVGVVGAGAWGTALANLMAECGADVTLWAYEPEVVDDINQRHLNTIYLDGITLSPNLTATHSKEAAVRDRDLVMLAVPSHIMRHVAAELVPHLPEGVPIVTASKGIEEETLMTMDEVLRDVLPLVHHPVLAYLSGPSFAREVALKHPTAVSMAARFENVAERAQSMVAAPWFRIYTSTDVIGIELGGAIKNVMAIGAGVVDGLGFGYNTTAALVTRGLAEMSRLAVRRGANPLTLEGLSGLGDLMLTCTGGLSRNRQVGQRIGRGETLTEILKDMKQVAEGVRTAKSVHGLAQREGIEMPIATTVYRMLYEDLPAREAVPELMTRSLKRELNH